MSSTSEKHPKKKRRIDVIEELPVPSIEVLPLVEPHCVRRSSRDPNRGMYPRKQQKNVRHFNESCPQFQKAAVLLKLSDGEQTKKSVSLAQQPGTSNSHNILEKLISSDSQPADSKTENLNDTIQQLKLRKKKGKPIISLHANKITKYFKSSPNAGKFRKVKCLNIKSKSPENIGTSGWLQKDEDLLQSLTDDMFFKNNCYGLVESAVENDGEDYFNKLPNHIVENVLCQIPILDLLACRSVCSRWTEIIDNVKFMEWKKLYFEYRKGFPLKIQEGLLVKYHKLISEGSMCPKVEDALAVIVNFMGKGFNRRPSPDMYSLLMQNPIGDLADQVLLERFPEWEGKEARVWCQFAIALLICETVCDVHNVYLSLFNQKTACSRHDILDAMYCILLFLLMYRISTGINHGLHYRIYCALYMIENHVPQSQREKLKIVKGLQGQQSIHSYSEGGYSYLTYEQVRILNHHFGPNQKIRIIALAGTGKTTTLLHLARLYPQIKFLNLVFNKSVSDEGKKKFPSNVTCQTAHSLAYSVTGKYLRHKLATKVHPYELIGHLKHNEGNLQIFTYAKYVITTIDNFVTSTATEMSLNHVPYKDFKSSEISKANRDRILMDAFTIWMKMVDKDDVSIKITHDVYLKLYHLKKPSLNKYQCIMVDEAQDCNPVMLDIVLSQNVPVVLVGDPNQQIYRFRGAQNALYSINATHTYHLTKSFRFGPQIAYIASCVLEKLMLYSRSTIVGSSHDSYIDGRIEGQYAIISRTNIRLFNEAIRIVVFKNLKKHEPTTVNAAFVGGLKSYGFEQILDICRLRSNSKDKPIKDKFISKFKSYSDLCTYAKYADDLDLLGKIEIVQQHESKIFKYLKIIKEKCSHPLELANVVFSTTHKAKGMEFDTVSLTDDFAFFTPMQILESDDNHEEISILYVALTRAKKCLLIPEKMSKLFHIIYEKFEYPVSSKSVLKDKNELKCVICECTFVPHTVLILMRRKVTLASGREIEEGPICMKCGSDPLMRPDVHINGIVMYLDPTTDNSHCFMNSITGPLPNDPPIVHDRFLHFENADRVFVINLNLM